jgi:hypothetical protein
VEDAEDDDHGGASYARITRERGGREPDGMLQTALCRSSTDQCAPGRTDEMTLLLPAWSLRFFGICLPA